MVDPPSSTYNKTVRTKRFFRLRAFSQDRRLVSVWTVCSATQTIICSALLKIMKSIDVELGIMPILAVEAPGLDSSSLSSFTGSNKRKSFENPEKAEDAANQENNSPNVPKKTASPMPQSATKKFKDALMNGQTVLHNGANLFMQPAAKSLDEASSIPSPLPRFNAAVKKITMVVPPAQETKRHVTEQNTAERGAPTPIKAPASSRKTPSKRDVALVEEKTLGPSSNCNALIKRLKAAISNSPSPEVIRAHFDTGFTITDERVAGIFAHMKIKNKWDFKEKAKKQDAVIKELRDCMSITLSEIKAVREKCLLQENHVINLLRSSYEEFLDVSQNLNTLHATSLKAQNELIKAQDELRNTSSTMMKFKTDQSPLRNRNKEFETRIIGLQAQLVLEQTQADQMAADYAKIQAEHAELKSKSESAIASMKEEYEQVRNCRLLLAYSYMHRGVDLLSRFKRYESKLLLTFFLCFL
jgi:hypothetical protein